MQEELVHILRPLCSTTLDNVIFPAISSISNEDVEHISEDSLKIIVAGVRVAIKQYLSILDIDTQSQSER